MKWTIMTISLPYSHFSMLSRFGSKTFRLDSSGICKLKKSFASTLLLSRNTNLLRPKLCQLTLRCRMASEPDKSFMVEKDVVSNSDVVVDNISSLIPSETVLEVATTLSTVVPEKSGWAATVVMNAIENIHLMANIPYWEAIVVATIGLRIFLIPVVIKTIQSTARLAILRPEMQKIQDIMAKDPKIGTDPKFQLKYQNEMKALFIKHKVNPLSAMIWPLFQLPIFITFFMALQDMGKHYPDFVNGGALWFVDLAAADATLLLPLLNSVSFVIMLEIGADGVQIQNQQTFKWAMRGMAVAMVPLTMSLPQGLFVYWGANNTFSIVQTFVLKNEKLRAYFNIPKPPAAVETPALKIINPLSVISEEKSKGEATEAEILDGPKKKNNSKVEVSKEKVITFAMPPKKDSVAK